MYRGQASNGYIKIKKPERRDDSNYIYFQYYDLKSHKLKWIYCGRGEKGIREAKYRQLKYLEEKLKLLNEETMKAEKRIQQEILKLEREITEFKEEIDIAKKIRPLTGKLDDYIKS